MRRFDSLNRKVLGVCPFEESPSPMRAPGLTYPGCAIGEIQRTEEKASARDLCCATHGKEKEHNGRRRLRVTLRAGCTESTQLMSDCAAPSAKGNHTPRGRPDLCTYTCTAHMRTARSIAHSTVRHCDTRVVTHGDTVVSQKVVRVAAHHTPVRILPQVCSFSLTKRCAVQVPLVLLKKDAFCEKVLRTLPRQLLDAMSESELDVPTEHAGRGGARDFTTRDFVCSEGLTQFSTEFVCQQRGSGGWRCGFEPFSTTPTTPAPMIPHSPTRTPAVRDCGTFHLRHRQVPLHLLFLPTSPTRSRGWMRRSRPSQLDTTLSDPLHRDEFSLSDPVLSEGLCAVGPVRAVELPSLQIFANFQGDTVPPSLMDDTKHRGLPAILKCRFGPCSLGLVTRWISSLLRNR